MHKSRPECLSHAEVGVGNVGEVREQQALRVAKDVLQVIF